MLTMLQTELRTIKNKVAGTLPLDTKNCMPKLSKASSKSGAMLTRLSKRAKGLEREKTKEQEEEHLLEALESCLLLERFCNLAEITEQSC